MHQRRSATTRASSAGRERGLAYLLDGLLHGPARVARPMPVSSLACAFHTHTQAGWRYDAAPSGLDYDVDGLLDVRVCDLSELYETSHGIK
jgi:hypothetical protein